ncbi:MAG: dolichyl-phosphate beta-glucosyltransferase [Chloroflexota bacterium]
MDKTDAPYLSVAISAYNEEKRIGRSLRRIIDYLQTQPYGWEIVVNDDGSRDRTIEVVRQFADDRIKLLSSPVNQGKGAGIKRAVLHSRGSRILFTDADLATPIEEVERLLERLDESHDIAIGCRIQPDGVDMRQSQPLYRQLLGKFFHFLVWLLVLRGIKDTQSGFKCFKRSVAHRLFAEQVLSSIIFDVEILYLARKYGYRIAEVPVQWNDVGGSTMRVSLGNALRVAYDIVRIPMLHRSNREAAAQYTPQIDS